MDSTMTQIECENFCSSFMRGEVDIKNVIKRKNYCEECDQEMELLDRYTCLKCGQCDSTGVFVTDLQYALSSTLYCPKSIYKRRLYCREKLKLLCGRKKCYDKKYKTVVDRLKKKKVKNLVQLKQYLKEWGFRKYYKHIYHLFFEVTGKKLISLTCTEISKMSAQFVLLEILFKRTSKRKNIYNYNSIIYLLMKKNKIKGYSHIILPLNHLHIVKSIKKYIK